MLLNQLVQINQKAIVANAVNFGLMDDPKKNLRLCEGFVFNYESDPNKIKTSTVGVLEALRRSFHSSSEPNIHLMVQDYGKGKSHFALAVANFFQKSYDSQEVQGILQQVEIATSKENHILESFKHFKQQGRNLVICLSGDRSDKDLKRQFIQAVKKTLNLEGINDAIAQQICKEPLQFLESLTPQQRELAEEYLDEIGYPEGDIDNIIEQLQQDDYRVITRVKEICKRITNITPDFEADIDVENILLDLITQLCSGENKQFNGILIIFDELYNYLQNWAADPVAAGGTTLQNITNICERYKGKIALLSLTQRRPGRVTPSKNVEDYNRLVSRVELRGSTYEPATSLELVLDNLLNQQTQTSYWQSFLSKQGNELNAINTNIFQYRTADYYKNRNWQPQTFRKYVTLGCFPLHPLTSYLLCNLDFTQGRGAIQFVQEDVENFIQKEPIEINDNINFIYPVALVDGLESNFSKPDASPEYSTVFSDYSYSINKVQVSADAELEELLILKALLLYYTSTGKLTKSDKEKHEELLKLLTGLTEKQIKSALYKLVKIREVIYLNQADNTYRFYAGGFGIDVLRKRIKEETDNNKGSALDKLINYCQTNISKYIGSTDTIPINFLELNRLRSEDWRYENKVFSVTKFKQDLNNGKILDGVKASGITAYVIGKSHEEILELRNEIQQLLERSPIKEQVVIAIISQPADNLARMLMEYAVIEKKTQQEFGAALTQLKQQYEKQINDGVAELFKSCTYHCHIIDAVPINDRNNVTKIVSVVLGHRYPYVPTVNNSDKMHIKSTAGSKIIGFVANRLLEDKLEAKVSSETSYKTVVEQVFANSWGLVKLVNNEKYVVAVPTQPNVKAAWEKISEMMTLDKETEKIVKVSEIWNTLQHPPYGYNEYTFTILFAGWLAYHRTEVLLSGMSNIPAKRSKFEEAKIQKEVIKKWVDADVFSKPKDFIEVWTLKGLVIRRKPALCPEVPDSINYDEAQQFIQEINNYLATAQDEFKEKKARNVKQILTAAIIHIDNLIEPISIAESQLQGIHNTTEIDVQAWLNTSQTLQTPLSEILEDKYSVYPTELQEQRRQKVLHAVIEKIEEIVASKCNHVSSLNTQEDCISYKIDIGRLITQVSQAFYLPQRFAEQLRGAIVTSEIRLAEITEQIKVNDCIDDIQKLYNSLSSLATQHEYIDTQSQIKNLAASTPIVKNKEIYKSIIKELESKQEVLLQKISDWENQFSQTISLSSALQMNTSINQEIQRFTEEDSKIRLNNLVKRLNGIILQRETEEGEAEVISDILENAARKLAEVKNTKKLSDALNAYKDLDQLKLPAQIKATALRKKPAELDELKSQGYTVISEKISQVYDTCNQSLSDISDYEQLKISLRQIKSFIANYDDFRRLSDDLQEAGDNLEGQKEEFQKQNQDKQTIASIRQNSPKNANTIHICEEAITNITNLRNTFNYPQDFSHEVDKLVQDFTNKILAYNQSLNDLKVKLAKIKTSKEIESVNKEYAQLNFVFQGSSEYTAYQQVQTDIDSLAQSLIKISNWETLYQQSNSIAECDRNLQRISQETRNLDNIERFQLQIEQIQANFTKKKQGYVEQLNKIAQKLVDINNYQDAQQLQNELNQKSAFYRESSEEQRYQVISSELTILNSLLQISTVQKLNTLDNCKQEQERLQNWCQNIGEIPTTVKTRYDVMLNELEKRQQQLEKQQRDAATKWLNGLVSQKERLEKSKESAKLDSATSLLATINTQRNQYENSLTADEQANLEQIIADCIAIQNQNKESRILILFQELPKDKRQSLLQRLTTIAENQTEEN